MLKASCRIGLALTVVFGGVWLAARGQPAAPKDRETAPFRRVPLSESQLAAALAKVEDGTLVRLSPGDFDRLVREAAAHRPTGDQPVIVEARYRARCAPEGDGEASLIGTAEWRVRHPGSAPTSLPLGEFQLAVRQAKWSDGTDAILYKASGATEPRLHVATHGDSSLNLEWSARGLMEPGEIRFDIRVPDAPVMSLDLELPSDLSPILPQAEAVLTGPFPAEKGSNTWRIAFGGMGRLELVLRRVADERPALFARLAGQQRLSEGEGGGRYEFQIESAKVGFTELTFDCDPDLTPGSVTVNNLLNWQVGGDGPVSRQLVVRLREPTRSATLVISGTFPVPWGTTRWTSPTVSLRDAVRLGERLQLSIAPGQEVRDWRPGGFRLVRAERSVDRSYVLELEPGPLPAGQTVPARPSMVIVRGPATSWRVVQRAEWNISARGQELRVKTTATVDGGTLRSANFRVPAGWDVDQVDVDGQEVAWAVIGAGPRRLSIDFGRPVLSGESLVISAQVRRQGDWSSRRSGELPFPDLFPLGGPARTGTVVVRLDPAIEVIGADPSPADPAPASKPVPSQVERPLGPEPLSGALYVRSSSARAATDIDVELRESGPGITAVVRMTVSPAAGAIPELRLWTPGPGPAQWVWRDAAGRRVADAIPDVWASAAPWLLAAGPLPPLATTGLTTAAVEAAGQQWTLRFPRPVDRPTTLHSEYTFASNSPADQWPLPSVVGRPFVGTIRVPSSLSLGGRFRGAIPLASDQAGERRFRYGQGRIGPPAADARWDAAADVDGVRLLTQVRSDGAARVEFRFCVRNWSEQLFPVTLPDGASAPAVSVGRRATTAGSGDRGDRRLLIPVPNSVAWTEVAVRYDLPRPRSSWSIRVESLLPAVPFDTSSARRLWHVSPEWRFVSTTAMHPLPGTADESLGLPLPDFRALLRTKATTPGPGVGGPTDRPIPVHRAIGQSLPGQQVFVDSVAASAAGLHPSDTISGANLGDSLRARGLVIVPCDGGHLLTRPDDVSRWAAGAEWDAPHPRSVVVALAEAADRGRDASGRFRTLDDWSGAGPDDVDALAAPPGWSVWEEHRGAANDLTLVRHDQSVTAVWLTGAAAAIVWIAMRRRPTLRAWALILCGVASLLAYHFLPVTWADVIAPGVLLVVFGGIAQAWWGNRPGTAIASDRPSNRSPAAAAGVVAAVCAFAAVALAAGPPPTVYEVLDRESRPKAVLVPPALLTQLRRDTHAGRGRPDVVVTGANYGGSRDGSTCRFRAQLRLHAFDDGPAAVTVPIQGVRFRSIRLDGSEPGSVEVTNEGLRLRVKGRGVHVLDLEFAVPITAVGADREVRFGVPEVPTSKVSFEVPGPAVRLRTTSWRGAIRLAATANAETLEADHGLNGSVSLRWQAEAEQKTLDVRARGAAVWDVHPGSATLSGAFEYRISGGAVTALHLAVPASASVRRVAVRAEAAAAGAAQPGVRDWTVAKPTGSADGVLAVELLSPATGRLVLQVDLVANTPPGERVELGFPRPLKATDVETQYAVAVQGFEPPASYDVAGLTEADAEGFASLWTAFNGSPLVVPTSRAFRPSGSQVARVGFDLRTAAVTKSVIETVTWWVAPGRLTAQGEARWLTGRDGLSLAEWTLPDDVTATEVSGRNLVGWSQTGNRVQAWLDRPMASPVLTWRASRGWADGSAIAVAAPTHPGAAADSVITRVRPFAGWSVVPAPPGLPGEVVRGNHEGELAWRSRGGRAARLSPVPPPAAVGLDVTTTIRSSGDRIVSSSSIDLSGLPGRRPHLLSVMIEGADDAEVRVQSPEGNVAKEVFDVGVGRRWDVSLPGANERKGKITVDVRPKASAPGVWALPRLLVKFGPRVQASLSHRLVVDPTALAVSESDGLTRIEAGAWKAVTHDWTATVVRRAGVAGAVGALAGAAQISAARAGAGWLYRGHYRVAIEHTAAIAVRTPTGTRLMEAGSDGVTLGVGDGEGTVVPVLPGSHTLVLLWRSDEPLWEPARIETGTGEPLTGPVEWTVCVPQGVAVTSSGATAVAGPESSTLSAEPLAEDREAFGRGVPHRYRVQAGQRLDLVLTSSADTPRWWVLGIGVGLLVVLAVLSVLWPSRSRPEQVAAASLIGAVTLGPAAAVLWLVAAGAIAWRGYSLIAALRGRRPPV
jgi:hypothetical protein